MRHSISWPTNFSSSAWSFAPLREAGMNARTPTSTRRPPLTTSSTVPAMVRLLREGRFETAPVARNLHLDGGEQVVAFAIPAADGDQSFHPRLQPDLGIRRQHAVHLAADIDKGAVRSNGDDGSLHRFAPRMVRLFELRKDVAKGGVGCGRVRRVGSIALGHARRTGVPVIVSHFRASIALRPLHDGRGSERTHCRCNNKQS